MSLANSRNPIRKEEVHQMSSILVLYHSQEHGNTASMARAIAEGARAADTDVTLVNTNEQRLDLEQYRASTGWRTSRTGCSIPMAVVGACAIRWRSSSTGWAPRWGRRSSPSEVRAEACWKRAKTWGNGWPTPRTADKLDGSKELQTVDIVRLGKTNLWVSRGDRRHSHHAPCRDQRRQTIRRALDPGVNFPTAPRTRPGSSP